MQNILTPSGYRPIADINVGDEVLAYDIATGAEIVNTVESKSWIDLAEWFRWHNDGRETVPDFAFVRVNGKWTLNSEQSIWVKRAGEYTATHAKHLEIGDEVYDGSDKPLTVLALETVTADGWWRFDISGDHSYICDDLTLHNASRFWVSGTGTWDSSTTTHWGSSSGTANNASAPGSADAATIDGSSGAGTITVDWSGFASSIGTFQSITCGAMGMTLDDSVNNHSATLSATTGFSGTGSGTRTISLGSGTFTLTATSGTPWNFATTTGLTFNANTSVITLTGATTSQRTFSGGGLTYATVTFGANSSIGIATIAGANTFTTLSVAGPNCINPTAAVTQTITNALNWSGSSGNIIHVTPLSSSAATLAVANGSVMSWAAVRGITASGNTVTVTNGMDCGGNTSFTITAPSGGGVTGVIGG